jgi:hypothetical protein
MTRDEYPDPLENLSRITSVSSPIYIPAASLVVEFDHRMMSRIRRIIEWHRKYFRFNREIVISDIDPEIPGVQFIGLETPSSHVFWSWYSDLCVHRIANMISDPYVLMWQWDGFIINPGMWTDEFLKWDYTGAPLTGIWQKAAYYMQMAYPQWRNPFRNPNVKVVGGGGFSLRSRRFLEASAKMPGIGEMYNTEDLFLCLEMRNEMEALGVRFCPEHVASSFAVTSNLGIPHSMNEFFGFHDRALLVAAKDYLESKYVSLRVPKNQPESSAATEWA